MSNRQFDTRTETKSSLSQQPVRRREQGHVAETSIFPERDPLPRAISSAGNLFSASTHAAMLKRATAGRPSRAGQSLLQLQRQYGNRYVQRVLDLARKETGEGKVAPQVEQAIQRERGGGQVLDKGVQGQMESSFGADFGGVRVHANTQADTLNREMNARAFTTGQDIFFRQGAYNPGSSSGRELLAHELTHVVQQTGGVRCKLTVGQAGDKYEQEADQVARAVIQQEQQPVQRDSDEGLVCRQIDEEEEVQMKSEYSRVQRQVEEEEEEPVQAKFTFGPAHKGRDFSRLVLAREHDETLSRVGIQRKSSVSSFQVSLTTTDRGHPLPETVRSKMEPALGEDFSDVRVHVDGQAEKLGGLAFTSGSNIHFARGKYNPDSLSGQELLGHELTHVVQQRRHRVPTQKATGSVAVVYDPALEAEAHAEGANAARAPQVTSIRHPKLLRSKVEGAAIQRKAVVQGVWPAWLVAIGIESWATAANVATVMGAAVGTAAVVGGAVTRGKTGAQSVTFPEKVITETDKAALAQIARFRIISEYINRYLAAHKDALKEMEGGTAGGGGAGGAATGPGTPPSPGPKSLSVSPPTGTESSPSIPSGTPEVSAIDQKILGAAADKVKADLARALESNIKKENKEFLWTESNAHDKPDDVGVTGTVKLRDIEGVAIEEKLELTGKAINAQRFLRIPGAGQTKRVKKFLGGRLYGTFVESIWDDLTISIVGGSVQTSVAEYMGGPMFKVSTEWYWSLAGPNSTTYLHLTIVLDSKGKPIVWHEYEDKP